MSVVVGGDGAGKSTLLRALVGLVPLHSGTARRPPKEEIGYVPATAGLYVDLTVDENLAFSGGAYGLSGAELARRTTDILERIGLSHAPAGRLGGQLSGGMQRKLAVGMALLHRPALLALDEPTTGVDPVSRAELWRLISAAAAGGTAVVATTTYVDEAQRASTVMLLEQGRSIATGTTSEIVAAIPGSARPCPVSRCSPGSLSWRWGATWRVWAPANDPARGGRALAPRLRGRGHHRLAARRAEGCSAMTVLAEARELDDAFRGLHSRRLRGHGRRPGRGRRAPRGERSRQDHPHPAHARAPASLGVAGAALRGGPVHGHPQPGRVRAANARALRRHDGAGELGLHLGRVRLGRRRDCRTASALPRTSSSATCPSACSGGWRSPWPSRTSPSSWCSTSPPPGSGR